MCLEAAERTKKAYQLKLSTFVRNSGKDAILDSVKRIGKGVHE